jgi:eukaryotic-like serine/threonine-protein kinase
VTGPIQLNPGTVFGGEFRIVKPLSAGGMGAVYVAEQASTSKYRALKLMHPMLLSDPRLRERFEQEARVGGLIKSDHVVQVISAGVDQTTRVPWIAMELLEGEDLGACLRRRGIFTPAEVYEVFRQIGHALSAAHAVGVVHRDMKPENIFLSRTRDATGLNSVKILDFGIAKVVAEAKTMATAALGTPLWMAPEQTDPRAPISPATDVWPLGLIAFTMLTGRVYWKTAGDPLAGMTALMREILLEPLVPAAQRAAELGAPGTTPPGFDGWFARCVNREPSGRFPTAAEALEALGPALFATGSMSRSVAPWPMPVAEPHRTKSPLVWIASSLIGVLGIAAVILFLLRAMSPSTPETLDDQKPKVGAQAPAEVPSVTAPVNVGVAPTISTGTTLDPIAKAPNSPKLQAPVSTRASPASTATSTSPPPAGRSFDHAAANAALQQSASRAKFMCKGREGPKVVSATVFFNTAGAVQRTSMDPQAASTSAGGCVMMALGGTRVPPFDSPTLQSASTVVGLD